MHRPTSGPGRRLRGWNEAPPVVGGVRSGGEAERGGDRAEGDQVF